MPATDGFSGYNVSLTAPLVGAQGITPDNTASLSTVTRAVYVGGAGDIRCELLNGDIVVLRNVQPGAVYPLRVAQVFATGTTATDLVGMY